MNRFIDETGHRYGRLTAVQLVKCGPRLRVFWMCQCTCGKTCVVNATQLRLGRTQSCGCLRDEKTRSRSTTHGESLPWRRSREYQSWVDMKKRCSCSHRAEWKNYGGRGIQVCERWQRFENFLADMGRCPPGLTLDRINNDGGYEPGNCRWTTRTEQNVNRRRTCHWTLDGKRMTVAEMAKQLAMLTGTLRWRLKRVERQVFEE